MPWVTVLVMVAVVVAILVAQNFALISARNARLCLKDGALIVDVRTSAEFNRSHVPNAINLPLAGLPDGALGRFADRNQVLLLHCLGGGRSAIAQRLLRASGYTRVYNLGSYRRAERLVRAARAASSTPGVTRESSCHGR
jgi:phage shock protein E